MSDLADRLVRHAIGEANELEDDLLAAAARIRELEAALSKISLAERDRSSSDSEKVRDMARTARLALSQTGGGDE
jgi:hypothetical protein